MKNDKKLFTGNYFTISKLLLNHMLQEKVKAELLCVFLVLARFSDKSNEYSFANIDAVSKILKIGRKRASNIIEELLKIKYYTPLDRNIDKYTDLNRKRHFKILKYGTMACEEVFFSNDLIGNKNDKVNNIANIFHNDNREVLIRILLMCHYLYDPNTNDVNGLLQIIGKDEDLVEHDKYYILIAQLKFNYYQSKKLIKELILSETYNEDDLTKQEMNTVDLAFDWLFEHDFLQKK